MLHMKKALTKRHKQLTHFAIYTQDPRQSIITRSCVPFDHCGHVDA